MAGETAIKTLDSVRDKIKERIQSEFVKIIPDEAWNSLINTVTEGFINEDLKPLILEQLKEKAKIKIKKAIDKLGFGTEEYSAESSHTLPSIAVEEMVKKLGPDLWEIAVAGIVQRAVDGIRSQLSSINY